MSSTALSAGQRDELVGLAGEMSAITKSATNEKRGLTADEISKLGELEAKAAPIKDAIRLLQSVEDITAMAKFDAVPATLSTTASKSAKNLGETFAESAAYKSFAERHLSGGRLPAQTRVNIDPVNVGPMLKGIHASGKALVSNNPIGAATATGTSPLVFSDRTGIVVDVSTPRADRALTGLVRRVETSSDVVEWVAKTAYGTNAAAVVAEAETVASAVNKPESTFGTWERRQTAIDTIAHWLPVTRQALWDVPMLQSMVNEFLLDGLAEKVEQAIQAAMIAATTQTVGSAGTDLDAILDAIKTVRVTGKPNNPTVILMSPDDWYSNGFALAKDAQGRYMLTDPTRSADDGINLWGRRLIITDQLVPNTAYVGDPSKIILWDRMQSTVSASDSHLDFFTKNLVAVLAEVRMAVTVIDPRAFCSVTAI